MYFEVTNDFNKWNSQYLLFGNQNKDIYFTYEYCYLHEINKEGYINAAIYKGENGTVILYPFLLKQIQGYEIKKKIYDIESCYGYGGPIVENFNEEDISKFEELFCDWCLNNNIVAEFIRFHPLLKNHNYFNNNVMKERNRITIYIDLEKEIDEIWRDSISSKNRNMIRKSEKLGVKIRASKNFSKFKEIYYSTMEKVDATEYYYFSSEYFDNLFKQGDKELFLLEAVLENETIASSVFLCSDYYMNYHLSGSNQKYLSFAPNNLLLYKAIEFGKARGLRKFHLGGGSSDLESDSLYKFKRSFSDMKSEFYIGKRVHNSDIYYELINQWEKKNDKEAKLFLQYRY